MSAEEEMDAAAEQRLGGSPPDFDGRSGFDSRTGVYSSLIKLGGQHRVPTRPDLDTATFVLSQFPAPDCAESRVALIDSATGRRVTYAELRRSIRMLATGLYHGLGIRKGDVVFLLAPNSLLYPTICLAVLSIGAVLTTANPLNTQSEISKQVDDSGAKVAISAPEELHKLLQTGVPTLLTHRTSQMSQSDTAAILYSSGTTGTSKGVILTHAKFIAMMTLLKWSVDITSSNNDVFLCFIPMFHIYGLAFFALGLLPVPPVILGLVKNSSSCDLSSLRRVGSGAAPLSKEVAEGFREKFPWVELRTGYGLTESCGAATYFVTDEQAKARAGSSGRLLPRFCAKVVDTETGLALPPNREGELWLKSPTVMKGYLGNAEATAATITSDGWLRTGDLCYFDEDGFLYIVDRIKELIKHNGYQVAPAELEAILLSHPSVLDAAVIPVEDEAAGQIPMAYVVRAGGSELTQQEVIQFVAGQVAPYKKVRKVGFINAIPRSTAGKILRKQLVLLSQQEVISKL
uniref:4-coumarate--CoA ligase-like 5 n=1 Tax=Vitis vinifera TaxID=29760 RepID=F6HNB1_VITVI